MSSEKIKDIFDSFKTTVSLDPRHRRAWDKLPKKEKAYLKKMWGLTDKQIEEIQPYPIIIQWSEKGRGFGGYAFYNAKGKIYCDNECDSRDQVKAVLCRLVDSCIFVDQPQTKKAGSK